MSQVSVSSCLMSHVTGHPGAAPSGDWSLERPGPRHQTAGSDTASPYQPGISNIHFSAGYCHIERSESESLSSLKCNWPDRPCWAPASWGEAPRTCWASLGSGWRCTPAGHAPPSPDILALHPGSSAHSHLNGYLFKYFFFFFYFANLK